MPVSKDLSDLSKLALVACDASYFTTINPVPPNSPLGPLNEGDPTVLPRFDIPTGFFEREKFTDLPGVQTGFKAIAYERELAGDPREVILAFGGCDGGLISNPTDWVSSTQHLGWDQWNENKTQIFRYLNDLPTDTKITFTGQSLGGALAQYAVYEWVQAQKAIAVANDTAFDIARISLVTFNALGGYLGLKTNLAYDPTILADLNPDQAAHFVITGDIASRLGGDPSTGIGHVGGSMYLLDYRTVDPDTGELVKLDLVEGHRIETGFYAGLHTLDAFTVATPLFQSQTPQQWYLPMTSLQNTASLLANIFNGRDVGRVDSYPRLLAGLMAGMTFGNQQEWDTLIKAYLTNQYEAGKMSDSKYTFYSATTLPVSVAGKPATTAIYAASVILAGLAESLGLGLAAIQTGLATLKSYLGISTGPDEPIGMLQGEYSQKAALVLAATGALSDSNSLRQEFLAHNLNPDEFAQQLLNVTGSTWRTDALTYLQGQLLNPFDKVQANGLTVAFFETLKSTPDLAPADLFVFAEERDAFIADMGSGFANAVEDFTRKITDVAFNLGQTLSSFSDIQLIDQAYAAELNDPRLSSSASAVIEEARVIFRGAAQTVVVQQGIGPNPFDTPGFNPASASFATGTLKEKGLSTFTAYLPFAAGTNGQAMQLELNGIGTNVITVLSGGQELVPVNGVVTLVIPEGDREAQFGLRAMDLSSDVTVSLDVQLVNFVNGTAVDTHLEHQEATITAANAPATDYANGLSSQLYLGTESDDVRDLLGSFNYEAHGNGGNDLIFSRLGNDQLYGDAGNDSLYGFVGHDQLHGGLGRDLLIADFRDDYASTSGPVAGQDIVDGGAEDDVAAGGGGDDQLLGGAGNDHLWGDNLVEGNEAVQGDPSSGLRSTYVFRAANIPGSDYLDGGDGDDLLLGNLRGDVLVGGNGADKLFGDQVPTDSGAPVSFVEFNGEADFLDGGDGNDLLQGDAGDDVLWGGAGNDQLFGDDRVAGTVAVGDDWIEGGAGDDLLAGGGGHDFLDGGADSDELFGEEGDDVLDGGAGIDQLSGGTGNDDLYGGTGDDILAGHDGADMLLGEDGADQLDGGNDNDELFGGAGNDVLFGQAGDDYLDGEENDDELQGAEGNDTLVGDIGNDRLFGDGGADTLSGDEGADQLTGGLGNDVLDGGTGSDTYVFDLGDGQDVIFEEDSLADVNTIQFVSPPVLPGYEGPPLGGITLNILTFAPNEAEHTLLIQVGTAGDSILLNGFKNTGVNGTGGIQNIVVAGVSYSLGELVGLPSGRISGTSSHDNIRTGSGGDIIQAGSGNDDVTSNAGNDQLFGGEGDDVLNAGDGNDLIVGGRGNDQLLGGVGQDTYRFNSGDGSDIIVDQIGEGNRLIFGAGIAPNDLTLEIRTGSFFILRTGAVNDQIQIVDFNPVDLSVGHPLASFEFADGTVLSYAQLVQRGFRFLASETQSNVINGSDFNDMMFGGPYADTFWGGGGDDQAFGVGGPDELVGDVGNDLLEGGWDKDLLFGGAGSDTLIGGDGDDYIVGNGVNVSGDGNDVFDGGAGNDLLADDKGANTYIFGHGYGHDVISSIDDFPGQDVDTLRLIDILPSEIIVQQCQNPYVLNFGDIFDLEILVNGGADSFILTHWIDFFPSSSVFNPHYQMERIEFADGTVWETTDLVAHAQGVTRVGTESDDQGFGSRLDGTTFDDVLIGLAGDDELTGFKGNDFLDGGAGNDLLQGDTGSDVYLFGQGYGSDTIYENLFWSGGMPMPDDHDVIRLGAGIMPDDVTLAATPNDNLVLRIGEGSDQLVIDRFFFDVAHEVEEIVFADGTVWDSTAIHARAMGLNHAPMVVSPLADHTVPEDSLFNIQVPANTFADEDSGDILTYTADLANGDALPSWLTFDPETQTFRGMPDDAQVGSLDLRVTATDTGNLTASAVFTLTVQNVNEAPSVATSIADQLAVEDAQFNFVVPTSTFHDVDADDLLTYRATLADGDALPAWISFEDNTGTFSGTPLNEDVGNLNIAVTATDLSGLSVTAPFAITVQNLNDAPIVANPLPDQEAAEDSSFSLSIPSATFADADAVHGDQLAYSVAQADGNALPTWLSFDASSLTLSGTPGPGDSDLLQIAVTVTDTEGASTTDQFALTISGPLPKVLIGTAGNDVLIGGRGDDVLSGLAGNDQLVGGQGNDMLDGGTGNDTMQGGPGNDTYVVDASGDTIAELTKEGMDWVQSTITYTLGANVENLTLAGTTAINGTGNALNNVLIGNGGNNRLSGGAGNDRLDGGVGSDTMVGNMGDDTYVVNQAGDVVTENLNEGTDTVESSISYALGSNLENLTLKGTANLVGTGNTLNNILIGNGGNNAFDGGAGNDIVDGGAGNDTLQGGSGDDSVLGGLGDDVLSAGSGNDVLDGGDGIDILDGGSGDDILRGGAGNDTLAGGSGADQLTGGTGNDTLAGGSGNDLYNFARGDGRDTIGDADSLKGNQDRLLFGTTINPLDFVISRQVNDLRLTIHGTSDSVTIQNWYTTAPTNQIEDLQAGNGQHLLNTQVDQLIQAMASFSQQTGLTWDQAIDQRPQEVQTILAASWH